MHTLLELCSGSNDLEASGMWHDSVSGLQWIANDNQAKTSSQRSDASSQSEVNGDAGAPVAEESFTEGTSGRWGDCGHRPA